VIGLGVREGFKKIAVVIEECGREMSSKMAD
jgi:hypothetical protein